MNRLNRDIYNYLRGQATDKSKARLKGAGYELDVSKYGNYYIRNGRTVVSSKRVERAIEVERTVKGESHYSITAGEWSKRAHLVDWSNMLDKQYNKVGYVENKLHDKYYSLKHITENIAYTQRDITSTERQIEHLQRELDKVRARNKELRQVRDNALKTPFRDLNTLDLWDYEY